MRNLSNTAGFFKQALLSGSSPFARTEVILALGYDMRRACRLTPLLGAWCALCRASVQLNLWTNQGRILPVIGRGVYGSRWENVIPSACAECGVHRLLEAAVDSQSWVHGSGLLGINGGLVTSRNVLHGEEPNSSLVDVLVPVVPALSLLLARRASG